MLLLALDTATPAVTVAVGDGRAVLAADRQVAANRHGELLGPLIAAVLEEAGVVDRGRLTGLVAGTGPGPFTGLRVGLVTAAALADALGVPTWGVCSLDAIAHGRGELVAASDARRREVYWAGYDRSGARVQGPRVDRPSDVPVAGRPVVGPATELYPDALPGAAGWPDPAALLTLGAARAAAHPGGEPLRPRYLRRPDAVPPGPPKPVLR